VARPGRRAPVAVVLVAALAGSLMSGAAAPGAVGAAPPGGAPPGLAREYVRVVDRPWQRVGVTITVIDGRGRPVPGLRRDEFRILVDGEPVEIADFGVEGRRADRPLSVAVLLDLSRSMGRQVQQVREAATALLRSLRPGDEILVARFDDQVTILTPFTGRIEDPDRTLRSLGTARGGTALFRAIGEILRDLRGRPGRKVVLVVTDGLDNDLGRGGHALQSLVLQDLLRACFRSQTVVYGVRPGMAATSWLPFEGFVEASGGRLLYTGGDLETLFARLGEEFGAQYHAAWDTDPKARPGRRRRIRIEVARPGVTVRALSGWSSPSSRLGALRRDARHDDPDVRADAVYELGFAPDEGAVRALLQALDDPDQRVRRLAAVSVGRQRPAAAIPRLIGLLEDPADPVRRAAAEALPGFGPEAISHLARFAGEGARGRPAPALAAAARALGAVGDERACEPLAGLLGEHPEPVRAAAAAALGALGLLCGLPAARGALADPAASVRIAAVRSIAAIAGDPARSLLERFAVTETDPAVRDAVRKALREAGADGSDPGPAPGGRAAGETPPMR
jgi:Ca-activated chloride channel family protein